MTNKKSNILPIVVMFLLFFMIAFVTNLCNPMAVIIKNNFALSNFAAQLGNAANFIAYAAMGIPAGFLLKKIGYRKTALLAIFVGIIGVFLQYMSGWAAIQSFWVYLIGAFVAGFCMCMLNTVVNPMLNTLGGGGNKGNQLVQFGGVCNSLAAVLVTIIMGGLIADAAKAKIADATPALMIALGVFAFAFLVLLLVKIPEPTLETEHVEVTNENGKKYSAFSFRHFNLGILAIFLYMGVEVGVPTYVMQYLSTPSTIEGQVIRAIQEDSILAYNVASKYSIPLVDTTQATITDQETILPIKRTSKCLVLPNTLKPTLAEAAPSLDVKLTPPGLGIDVGIVGMIVAIYWLLMLVGRFLGGMISAKVSSRAQIIMVSSTCIILVLLGMFLPTNIMVSMPGIDWATLTTITAQVPVGIFPLILVGLCTSVMWGGIFNMAVEGLGKYTSIASGAFMTMVCGGGILIPLQGKLVDVFDNFQMSYIVVVLCALYILFYALIGSKNVNKDIPTE